MARLQINYSFSYDWLVRGCPDEDWREPYERGLAHQAAARAEWEPYEDEIFAAFESIGLRFWESWPAYPVHLPEGVSGYKDPLTFHWTKDWEDMRTLLVHELCHVHEDHPVNRERYEAVLGHIRSAFPDEDEGVQYHLITCTLQRAVLMRAFPDRWGAMVALAGAGQEDGHPVLRRTWELIGEQEAVVDWRDPLGSLALFR